MKISCDDGCASDVRLAELCNKYEIECIFYWPVELRSLAYENGYEPLTHYDAQQIADNFEIGSHTITHRHLTRIPFNEAVMEILDSKTILQDIYGKKVTKFCPPRGYTSEELTKITLEKYKEQRLTKQSNLVHVHPKSGANEEKPWRECINENTEEIWCHSYELNRFNLWEELEDVLRTHC